MPCKIRFLEGSARRLIYASAKLESQWTSQEMTGVWGSGAATWGQLQAPSVAEREAMCTGNGEVVETGLSVLS